MCPHVLWKWHIGMSVSYRVRVPCLYSCLARGCGLVGTRNQVKLTHLTRGLDWSMGPTLLSHLFNTKKNLDKSQYPGGWMSKMDGYKWGCCLCTKGSRVRSP